MKNIIAGIANRFKEPSSYAGIGIILGAFGLSVEGLVEPISLILAGISGVVAFVLKEKK